MEEKLCSVCHFPLNDTFYFCPNCGKQIKDPIAQSIGKQIGVYAISVLLPPIGLWPGLRYVFQKDQKIRKIGFIAILLTIISSVLTIWITVGFMHSLDKSLNQDLQHYQNLGY